MDRASNPVRAGAGVPRDVWGVKLEQNLHARVYRTEKEAWAALTKMYGVAGVRPELIPAKPAGEIETSVWRTVHTNSTWERGRAGSEGRCHLKLGYPLWSGRLLRAAGDSLCGGWAHYEVPAEAKDWELRLQCPKCVELANRHGLKWPDPWPPNGPPP